MNRLPHTIRVAGASLIALIVTTGAAAQAVRAETPTALLRGYLITHCHEQ